MALAGLAGSAPAALAVIAFSGVRTGSGALTAESALVAVALLAGCAISTAIVLRSVDVWERSRLPRPRRSQLAVGVAVALIVAILVGPSLLDDFNAVPRDSPADGRSPTSGSGRTQFWEVALKAGDTDLLRGIGAGGFTDYWNANGTLVVSVDNPHSGPLQVFAELGIPGVLLLAGLLGTVAFAVVAGLRGRASPQDRARSGVIAAILLAGLVGFLIDWTWEMPAAFAAVVVAAALACRGPRPRLPAGLKAGKGAHPLALALTAAVSATAIVAGLALAVSSGQIESAERSLARGDLAAAAGSARTAAAVAPYDAEPHILLAEIEQVGRNFEAARLQAERAARLAPMDYRPWLLLTQINLAAGNRLAAFSYGARAASLSRADLGRAIVEARRP